MTIENNHLADEVMCTCTGTTRSDIQTLFELGFDMNGIASKRGVLSGCGGCEWGIEAFLETLAIRKK